jgi:hypothetical protein
MRLDFIATDRPRVNSDFIELALKTECPVRSSAEESGAPSVPIGTWERTNDLRITIAVQVNAYLIVIAHHHDVVPSPQSQNRSAREHFRASIGIVQNQLAGEIRARGAAYAQNLTRLGIAVG